MENPSRTQARDRSSSGSNPVSGQLAQPDAPGRLNVGKPVAIVDIGSNSVRLVAYEGSTRAPTPIFNEKVMAGLGRGIATSGRLPREGVEKALSALRRYRALLTIMEIADVSVLATAAARDAKNGAEFLDAASAAIGAPIQLLSGKREAQLSALGVISSIHRPDGVVGDLGGGSLELIDVDGYRVGDGITLPLGGLTLMDASKNSTRAAAKIARDALRRWDGLERLKGRSFYAIGGTWRALAKLHMHQRNYPLNVMHGYTISAREAGDFATLVERVQVEALTSIGSVPAARRPLLAYGAVVLEEIIERARPRDIVISALGVREGLLYERLNEATQRCDPLLVAARELNVLRSRSPQHGEDLCAWTDAFVASTRLGEEGDEMRLRHAACLLADIGWRAHPDYRGEQSLNIIAHAAFVGVDHAGRAFLALSAAFRHMGIDEDVSPQIRALVSPRMLDRARILGAAMRVAYLLSAAMPGILTRVPMVCEKGRMVLTLPSDLADLASDRLLNRMKQLARLLGRDPQIIVASS